MTAIMLLSILVWPTGPAVLYVSPSGDDAWSGRLAAPNKNKTDGPFRTIAHARDTLNAWTANQKKGGVVVSIRGGTYPLTETLKFTTADSGSPGSLIRYEAFKDEHPVISGGRSVSGWTELTDKAVLSRLPDAAKGHVVVADLRSQGITDFGKFRRRGFGIGVQPAPMELFHKGTPMQLARWPNKGEWTRIAAVPGGPNGGRFGYESARPSLWAASSDIWVHGYWTWDWADSYEHVAKIETTSREVTTDPPHGVYGYKKGARYYFLNVLEELNQPGEYYLDRERGLLYFWPPEPLKDGDTVVSLLEGPLLSIEGATLLEFAQLGFENSRGSGVVVREGMGLALEGCSLKNLGNTAVSVFGRSCLVQSCDIFDVGECGIEVAGGNRMTLESSRNVIDNNHIFRCQRWCFTYFPAIRLDGVTCTLSRNLIHDLPHSAILGGGNNHRIIFNEIHHVCMETHDAGAFYMGRDWTWRGNQVLGNYFHDLGQGDVNAVYLDDWLSGTKVEGNIFYRAGRGVMIGGGRDNEVRGNVFVECNPAIHVDARGKGWASYYFDGKDNTLFDRLKAVNGTQPPYSYRYPQLKTILQDDPAWPKGNVIERNINFGGRWLDLLDNVKEKDLALKDNWTQGDPGFVDPAKGDYRIRSNGPVSALKGWSAPDDAQIGIRKDAYRKSLPARTGPRFGMVK